MFRISFMAAFLALFLCGAFSPAPAASLTVYDDALRNGFQDWSWATHSLTATAYVHGGTYAISMVPANWSGLYFHTAGVSMADNGALDFWIHGGSSGHQQLRFYLYSGGQPVANAPLDGFIAGGAVPAGSWALVHIPFATLGVTSGTVDGLVLQADAASTQATVYLDDLVLLDTAGPLQPVIVAVDPWAGAREINPLIYGVSYGTTAEFSALPYPLRRWGGNATTRYNWRKDATNHGFDWFFINLPENADSTGLPDGSSCDLWLDESLNAGASAILTVPTIGWTARDRQKRWGFSVARYGAQQATECTASGGASWCQPDAGNGVLTGGTPVTGNNPLDTSVAIGPDFVQDWVRHLLSRFGAASAGGVRYYALDNEPMLWNSTHRDVHPAGLGYDELWNRTQQYAEAVKAIDPSAAVLGPVCWGWCDYFYSAADGCQAGADQAAHGGLPLLVWYLQQNHQRELATGQRPVDILDVHYYPQAGNVALSDDESVAALRLRSLKSLYDPSYVDESWIAQPVRLIPRLREWIDTYCPGMQLALTEYNWGGDTGISSALAQAEALAIFGREGVDQACRWVAPQAGSKVLEAFRLYLDYDGQGHNLSGQSVQASSSDVDGVGAYAIRTETQQAALLLFNKATVTRTVQGSVLGSVSGPAPAYRFDASTSLGATAGITFAGGAFTTDLPARSATLVLVPLEAISSAAGRPSGGAPGSGLRPDGAPGAAPTGVTVRPNPFRSSTRISFRLERAAPVALQILDVAGREMRSLRGSEDMPPGAHSIDWDGRDGSGEPVARGLYFLRLRAGQGEEKLRLVKVE